MELASLELCAGAGGQAIGLERAGFACAAAVELDHHACATLRANRPHWEILEQDVRDLDGRAFRGVDLVAGGVPCPPFSIAGKQLGANDERDLFPEALRIVSEARPAAVLLENVPGFASAKFTDYRLDLLSRLSRLGYVSDFRVVNASDFGLPQLRPRFVLVALRERYAGSFEWPVPTATASTVGHCLVDLMGANGWPGCPRWVARADGVGPTIVGGSKKHGGADLGPTRAKEKWRALGVDGKGIANEAPGVDFPTDGFPRLTLRMVARLQGFPDEWAFEGGKTASYRQMGNAFPPPVPAAVGAALSDALSGRHAKAYRREANGQMYVFESAPNL